MKAETEHKNPIKLTGLCPICGEYVSLRVDGHGKPERTKNERLIGSCQDAFTVYQWLGPEEGEE